MHTTADRYEEIGAGRGGGAVRRGVDRSISTNGTVQERGEIWRVENVGVAETSQILQWPLIDHRISTGAERQLGP